MIRTPPRSYRRSVTGRAGVDVGGHHEEQAHSIAVGTVLAGLPLVGLASPAAAHPHQTSVAHQGTGQELANGANHGPYVSGLTCGGDHAVYGLETAHHGPDSGTSGKADGCYQLDGTSPALDVANPVIR